MGYITFIYLLVSLSFNNIECFGVLFNLVYQSFIERTFPLCFISFWLLLSFADLGIRRELLYFALRKSLRSTGISSLRI